MIEQIPWGVPVCENIPLSVSQARLLWSRGVQVCKGRDRAVLWNICFLQAHVALACQTNVGWREPSQGLSRPTCLPWGLATPQLSCRSDSSDWKSSFEVGDSRATRKRGRWDGGLQRAASKTTFRCTSHAECVNRLYSQHGSVQPSQVFSWWTYGKMWHSGPCWCHPGFSSPCFNL